MSYEVTSLIDALNENGIHVIVDRAFDKIEFDFSEHDKIVAEEKDAQIRELKRQIEDLEAIIADGKKPDISVSENGVSVGCECGGYHLAKERITKLEEKLKNVCDKNQQLKIAVDVLSKRIAELMEVHEF